MQVAVNLQQPADIASKIAATMRQMGVAGLPRNYELFYEVCRGANEVLCEEMRALGLRPTQEQLDQLAHKFIARGDSDELMNAVRDQVAAKIEEVMALLRRERSSLEKYGSMLDTTSDGLRSPDAITQEILLRIVSIMSAATASTIEQGRQIASSIGDKSAELERVKCTLEEYKKLADTDQLTQIWNRRAFDRAIAAVYDSPKGRMFNALILADIDRFKDVNDRFGHPVGDRIIRIVANIITSKVQPGLFVARTGGEEFAVIAEGLSEEGMAQVAEGIRSAVEEAAFVNRDDGTNYGPITMSLGICMAADANGADDLYAKADRALYASKVSGRNRVTRFNALSDKKARKNWFIYRSE